MIFRLSGVGTGSIHPPTPPRSLPHLASRQAREEAKAKAQKAEELQKSLARLEKEVEERHMEAVRLRAEVEEGRRAVEESKKAAVMAARERKARELEWVSQISRLQSAAQTSSMAKLQLVAEKGISALSRLGEWIPSVGELISLSVCLGARDRPGVWVGSDGRGAAEGTGRPGKRRGEGMGGGARAQREGRWHAERGATQEVFHTKAVHHPRALLPCPRSPFPTHRASTSPPTSTPLSHSLPFHPPHPPPPRLSHVRNGQQAAAQKAVEEERQAGEEAVAQCAQLEAQCRDLEEQVQQAQSKLKEAKEAAQENGAQDSAMLAVRGAVVVEGEGRVRWKMREGGGRGVCGGLNKVLVKGRREEGDKMLHKSSTPSCFLSPLIFPACPPLTHLLARQMLNLPESDARVQLMEALASLEQEKRKSNSFCMQQIELRIKAKKLQDELRASDVPALKQEVASLQDELAQAKALLDKAEEEKEELLAQLQEAEAVGNSAMQAEVEHVRGENNMLMQQLDMLALQFDQEKNLIHAHMAQKEEEVQDMKLRLADERQEREEAQRRLEESERRREAVKGEMEAMEQQAFKMRQSLVHMQRQITEAEHSPGRLYVEALEEQRSKVAQLEQQVAEKGHAEQELQQLQAAMAAAEAQMKERETQLSSELASSRAAKESLQKQLCASPFPLPALPLFPPTIPCPTLASSAPPLPTIIRSGGDSVTSLNMGARSMHIAGSIEQGGRAGPAQANARAAAAAEGLVHVCAVPRTGPWAGVEVHCARLH
ncbi:unnamed protein product [Closterium sp. NIES-53]